jgi:hypothetical protein
MLKLTQNPSIGRIEKMRILRLRNLFLVSSALALVMLFGCSSSEEEETSAESSSGGDPCHEQCLLLPSYDQDECLAACAL